MINMEGYLEYHGGYHEYRTVGDIMSTMGDKNLLLFEYPHGTQDIPTCIMISPMVHKLQRMVNIPTVLMISPMALSIPHGTQDSPPPQYS